MMKKIHLLLFLTTFAASQTYCDTNEMTPTGDEIFIYVLFPGSWHFGYKIPVYKTQKEGKEVRYISLDDLAKEKGTSTETLRKYWTIKVDEKPIFAEQTGGTPRPFEQIGNKYYIKVDWPKGNFASLIKETFISDKELLDISSIIKAHQKALKNK